MIQRIQSIFLLLAAGTSFGVLGSSFANAKAAVASPIFADQVYNVQDNIALLVVFAVAGALALASIFLFKNRKTQLQISTVAMVANLLGLGYAAFLLYQDQVNVASLTVSVGAFLPLIAILLEILANRAIRKDNKLVRSMDRLR